MAEHRRTSAEMVGPRRIAFGDYQFDCGAGQLWRGDEEIKLAPRASALLAALAERSMQVVTKAELIDRLWDGKAVGDDALTSCVKELRRALGDDPQNPRFVETRHRRGYRLLLPVGPQRRRARRREEHSCPRCRTRRRSRPAVPQHVGRSRAGVFRRRHHGRHHHRAVALPAPVRDRAQFEFRLQGQGSSTSARSLASWACDTCSRGASGVPERAFA